MAKGLSGARTAGAAWVAPLLERQLEASLLAELVRRALAGTAGIAVVEGQAGIGKSRLVEAAKADATRAGLLVLGARGSELEHQFPFGVVRQLFEAPLREGRGAELRGAAAPAATVLGVADDSAQPATDPSFASLHGLYWLTVHLSEERPLLLAIDDLHWCDTASLRFLTYLQPRLTGLPVLVVCSLRSVGNGHAPALIDAILCDPSTVALRPRPLSEAATAALVEARLGTPPEPEFTASCHRTTGGNPLLLTELLKELASEGVIPDRAHLGLVEELGPRSVSRALFLRLRRLPAAAISVASALAVLGDGADLHTVAKLANLADATAAEAVTALTRAEVVRTEMPLGFVHPLVAATIYRDIPLVERQLRHRRAAELLAEVHAGQRVASHLLQAPGRGEDWAVKALVGMANEALLTGAADSAVAYLRRALTEPPPWSQRAWILLALGSAEALTSAPAAVGHLREALANLGEPSERAQAAQLLGRALLLAGFPGKGAEVARNAREELPAGLEDLGRALEAFEALCVTLGGGHPDALARLRRYRHLPVGTSVGAKMLAAMVAQHWVYECGPSDACSRMSMAALAGGDLIAADNGLLATCAITNLVFADREEAEGWWEVARADAHQRGSLFAIASFGLWRGFAHYWRGELPEAEDLLRGTLDDFGRYGFGESQGQIFCHSFLAGVLRERGDIAGARATLARSTDPGCNDDGARYWCNSRTEQLLAEHRFKEAVASADDYAARFAAPVRNPMDAPWRSHKALALYHLGQQGEAIELVNEELKLAYRWGAPRTVARTLRTLAAVKRDGGLEHLEEAVAAASGTPSRLEHAKALAAFGTALRRSRRLTEARQPLRQAFDLASACGCRGLVEHVRTELYAAGARPRRAALNGVGSLTASERRIAALAAEGRTNREMAETLFVTPKTVAMHLSNVYRKLGVDSRRELPGALAGVVPNRSADSA